METATRMIHFFTGAGQVCGRAHRRRDKAKQRIYLFIHSFIA